MPEELQIWKNTLPFFNSVNTSSTNMLPSFLSIVAHFSLSLSLSLYLSLSGSLPLLTLQDFVFSQAHSLLLAVATLSTCCRYWSVDFLSQKRDFPETSWKVNIESFASKHYLQSLHNASYYIILINYNLSKCNTWFIQNTKEFKCVY